MMASLVTIYQMYQGITGNSSVIMVVQVDFEKGSSVSVTRENNFVFSVFPSGFISSKSTLTLVTTTWPKPR